MNLLRFTPFAFLLLAPALAAASDPPLACQLDALKGPERERQHHLVDKITRSVLSREELPLGYSFLVNTEKIPLPEIAEWISLESRCCPFLDFTLDVSRNSGSVRVKLTGGRGVKEFVKAEIGPEARDAIRAR